MELCEATGGVFVPGVPSANKRAFVFFLLDSDAAESICDDTCQSVALYSAY